MGKKKSSFGLPNNNILMMIALLVSKMFIDFEDPNNLLLLRAGAATVLTGVLAVLGYFYFKIITAANKDESIFVKPSQLKMSPMQFGVPDPEEKDDKKEMTIKEYDLAILWDVTFGIMVTCSISLGIHGWFGLTPPLFLLMVAQPKAIYETTFFRIYILGQDEKIYRELRRPWPTPKKSGWQKSLQDKLETSMKELDAQDAPVAEKEKKVEKKGGKKGKKNR
mmetsp:Transcript_17420/g.28109  ORF Transcript_17420/g.28109 Transcript_17420/m.28109 type:complete len:222 (+) Transcript_17420:92-757(+)